MGIVTNNIIIAMTCSAIPVLLFAALSLFCSVDALQCPIGYNLVEEEMCFPPPGYMGPCAQMVPIDVSYYQIGDRWSSDMNWCGMVIPLVSDSHYQTWGPCPRFYQWNETSGLCETTYGLPCPVIPGIASQADYDLHHLNWSVCAVAVSGDWAVYGKLPFVGAKCPDDWILNTTSRCRVTLDSQNQCPSDMKNFYDYCVYAEDWTTVGDPILRYRRRPQLGCDRFPMMANVAEVPSRINEMRRCGFNFYCNVFDSANPSNNCPENYDRVDQQCVAQNGTGHPCDVVPVMLNSYSYITPQIWSRCGLFFNPDGWHCPVQMTPLQMAVPDNSYPDSANSNECVQSATSASLGKTGKCWSFEPPFDFAIAGSRDTELLECVTSM